MLLAGALGPAADSHWDRPRCRHILRHCERSEAIQNFFAEAVWIASSQELLAMTAESASSAGFALTMWREPDIPYDNRISSSRRPSPFKSFFTALEATTSPSLA